MSLDDDAHAELTALEDANRLRVPRVVDGAQGPTLTIDGAAVINLSSNDYLSLAGDRRLVRAAQVALDEAGAGAGASRLISGTQRAHVVLERAVEGWLERDGVRLFNSGYAANLGVLTTLLRPGDVVCSDELNHASLIDGCRLARADVRVFPHGDLGALETLLAQRPPGRCLVVTESLFSMDGDIADLPALASLCARHDAALIVDEAHALGVHGPEGRGLCAELAVEPAVLIGTFGKALGSFGAFVASSAPIARLLWNRARPLVFSTALPSSVAAASLAALEIVRTSEGQDLRRTVANHARRFRTLVRRAGGSTTSAIAPIRVGDDREVMEISARLLEAGIFVQGIRPPTVAVGTARLRVSVAAGHSIQQIETASEALNNALRQ